MSDVLAVTGVEQLVVPDTSSEVAESVQAEYLVIVDPHAEQATETLSESLLAASTELELLDSPGVSELLEISTQGPAGPPGPAGPQGPAWDQGGAFMVVTRFAEIAADETAKTQARANLGLQDIDGGTFN